MRITLLSEYYPAYLRSFAAANDVARLGCDAHLDLLLEDYFGAFVSYRNWFRSIGHRCDLVIANAYDIQQKWLDEHGIPLQATPAAKHEVVLRQLAEQRPDVLFVGSMFDYYGEFFRKAADHVGRIVCWIACPHPENLDFSHVSCVVSSVQSFVDEFRARGVRSERLAAAFDEDVAQIVSGERDDLDVTFVGGLNPRTHRFRVACIRDLLDHGIPLKLWGFGISRRDRFFRTKLARALGDEAWGMDMYRILARSKITLNFHIDVARQANFVGNMRMYEATGCGALLLTDTGPGISALFEPGREVETFGSRGELLEKIRHYLDHPADREAIARRGQQACLARHGYAVRIREFERILLDVL